MQWSVRINEAYQRLKDPLRRASYLCELHDARR
jgi:molecular chaperone HscB